MGHWAITYLQGGAVIEGWIAIGELAKDLKTNCAKTGQLARILKFETKKKSMGTSTYKYISLKDAEILKIKFKEFKGELGRKKKQGFEAKKKLQLEKKKERDKAEFERLFDKPIMAQDFGTGTISGQGMRGYWDKQREAQG